jgi:hypothetical protein
VRYNAVWALGQIDNQGSMPELLSRALVQEDEKANDLFEIHSDLPGSGAVGAGFRSILNRHLRSTNPQITVVLAPLLVLLERHENSLSIRDLEGAWVGVPESRDGRPQGVFVAMEVFTIVLASFVALVLLISSLAVLLGRDVKAVREALWLSGDSAEISDRRAPLLAVISLPLSIVLFVGLFKAGLVVEDESGLLWWSLLCAAMLGLFAAAIIRWPALFLLAVPAAAALWLLVALSSRTSFEAGTDASDLRLRVTGPTYNMVEAYFRNNLNRRDFAGANNLYRQGRVAIAPKGPNGAFAVRHGDKEDTFTAVAFKTDKDSPEVFSLTPQKGSILELEWVTPQVLRARYGQGNLLSTSVRFFDSDTGWKVLHEDGGGTR